MKEMIDCDMMDCDIIDAGIKSMIEFGNDDLMAHFIYSGYSVLITPLHKIREMFLTKMAENGIQSCSLTLLYMLRENLITKEKAKEASEGKLKKGGLSINDDLEDFFTYIKKSMQFKEEEVYSYFTPKLSQKELKLVEVKDKDHFNTYLNHHWGFDPDVDAKEMAESDSKSKYVHVSCGRATMPLMLERNEA